MPASSPTSQARRHSLQTAARKTRTVASLLHRAKNTLTPQQTVNWSELVEDAEERMLPLCSALGTTMTAGSVWQESLRDRELGIPGIAVGEDGLVAAVSRAFEALAGRSQEEMVGRSIFDIRFCFPQPLWLQELLNGQAKREINSYHKAVAMAQKKLQEQLDKEDAEGASLPNSPTESQRSSFTSACSRSPSPRQRRHELIAPRLAEEPEHAWPEPPTQEMLLDEEIRRRPSKHLAVVPEHPGEASPTGGSSSLQRLNKPRGGRGGFSRQSSHVSANSVGTDETFSRQTSAASQISQVSLASSIGEPFFKTWEPPTTKNFNAYAETALRQTRITALSGVLEPEKKAEPKAHKHRKKKKAPKTNITALGIGSEELVIVEVQSARGLPRGDGKDGVSKQSVVVTCIPLGAPDVTFFSTPSVPFANEMTWGHHAEIDDSKAIQGGLVFSLHTEPPEGASGVCRRLGGATLAREQFASGSFFGELALTGTQDSKEKGDAFLTIKVELQRRKGNPLLPRCSLMAGEAASGFPLWQLLFTFQVQHNRRLFAVHVPVLLTPPVPDLLWPMQLPKTARELPMGHDVCEVALARARESIGAWTMAEDAKLLVNDAEKVVRWVSQAFESKAALEGHHFVPKLGSVSMVPIDELRAWEAPFARIEPQVTASWATPDASLVPEGSPPGAKAPAGRRGASCCVVDPSEPDCPLAYISPGFEDLTGYWRAFALGRNCRFVQPKDRDRNRRYNGMELARISKFCKQRPEEKFLLTLLLCQTVKGQPFWILLYLQYVDIDTLGDGETRPYIFGLQIPLPSQEEALTRLLPWEWNDRCGDTLKMLRDLLAERLEHFDLTMQPFHVLADRVVQEWAMQAGRSAGAWISGDTFAPPVGMASAMRFARLCKEHREPQFLDSVLPWEKDASPVLAVLDPMAEDFPLVYAGAGFEELTGYDEDAALGRNIRLLQPTSQTIAMAANSDEIAKLDAFCSRLSGRWISNAGSEIVISGYTGKRADSSTPLVFKSMGQDVFSFDLDGKQRLGQLLENTITWDSGEVWRRRDAPAASRVFLLLGEQPSGERFWVLLRAEQVRDELDFVEVQRPAALPSQTEEHRDSQRTALQFTMLKQRPSGASPPKLAQRSSTLRMAKPYVRLSFVKLVLKLPSMFRHRDVTEFDDHLPEFSNFGESLREWMDEQKIATAPEAAEAVAERYNAFLQGCEDYRGEHFCPRIGMTYTRRFESLGGFDALAKQVNDEITRLLEISNWREQAYCVADPGGEDCPLIHVSRGFEDLTGYSREQALGRSCRYLQPKTQDRNEMLNGEERRRLRSFCTSGLDGKSPAEPCLLTLLVNERRDMTCFLNLLWLQRTEVGGRTYFLGVLTPLESDIQRLVEALSMDEDGLRQLQRLRGIIRRREGCIRGSSLKRLIEQSMAEWAADFPPQLEMPSLPIPEVEGKKVPYVGMEVCCATARIETVVSALESGVRHFHITFREIREVSDAKLNVFGVRMVSLRLAELLNLLRQHNLYCLREGIVFTVCSPPRLIDTFPEVQKALKTNGYHVSGWLLDARNAEPEVVSRCWAKMSAAKQCGEVGAIGLSGGGARACETVWRAGGGAKLALYALDVHPGRRNEDAEERLLAKLRAEGTTLMATNVYRPSQAWWQSPEARRVLSRLQVRPEILAVKWCEHQAVAAVVPSKPFSRQAERGVMHRTYVRDYRQAPSAEDCFAACAAELPSAAPMVNKDLAAPPAARQEGKATMGVMATMCKVASLARKSNSGASKQAPSGTTTRAASTSSSHVSSLERHRSSAISTPMQLPSRVFGSPGASAPSSRPCTLPDAASRQLSAPDPGLRPHTAPDPSPRSMLLEAKRPSLEWPRVSSYMSTWSEASDLKPLLPSLSRAFPTLDSIEADDDEIFRMLPDEGPRSGVRELPQLAERPMTSSDDPTAGGRGHRRQRGAQSALCARCGELPPSWGPVFVRGSVPRARAAASSSSPRRPGPEADGRRPSSRQPRSAGGRPRAAAVPLSAR